MVVAVLFAAAAFAQTSTPAAVSTKPVTPAEKAQMKTMRQDVRKRDDDKAAAKKAINHGNLVAAKTDVEAAKTEKTAIAADRKDLKSEGVTHPEKLAAKEVKKTDEKAVKTEVKDVKEAKTAEKADAKAGDKTAAATEKTDVKTDKKDLKKDIKDAKKDGIKHPLRRA